MGPFDKTKQKERFARLDQLASNPCLPKATRMMWANKRDNLALDEQSYNARVKEIFSQVRPIIQNV